MIYHYTLTDAHGQLVRQGVLNIGPEALARYVGAQLKALAEGQTLRVDQYGDEDQILATMTFSRPDLSRVRMPEHRRVQ